MGVKPERLGFGSTYLDWAARHKQAAGKTGLRHAIGGEFDAFGVVERELLRFYGLRPEHYLVDVGCGAGRLTRAVVGYLTGRYLGTDVVPDLVAEARSLAQSPDWTFHVSTSFQIPEADATAEFVCFFSVFTHLLHEQSYLYLEEARRVLKPGGRVVISFLEFAMDFQWSTFEQTISHERSGTGHPLNVFIERVALAAWARHLGFSVVEFRDGDDTFVPLPERLTLDDGRVMDKFGNLGQSICVLECP